MKFWPLPPMSSAGLWVHRGGGQAADAPGGLVLVPLMMRSSLCAQLLFGSSSEHR